MARALLKKNKSKNLNSYNCKVNKFEALFMCLEGANYTEVADAYDVSVSAISQMLKPYKDALQLVKAFGGKNKDKFFELVQMMVGHSLKNKDINKMQGLQKITGMAILQDKIDQIRGEGSNHGLVIAPVNIITINTSGKDNEKSAVIEVVNQDVLPPQEVEK